MTVILSGGPFYMTSKTIINRTQSLKSYNSSDSYQISGETITGHSIYVSSYELCEWTLTYSNIPYVAYALSIKITLVSKSSNVKMFNLVGSRNWTNIKCWTL